MKSKNLKFEGIGTHWEIELEAQSLPRNIDIKIKDLVDSFESKYSRFRDDSLISSLSGKTGEFRIDSEFVSILNLYLRLNKLTDGKFTPFIAMRLNDLGYDKEYSFHKRNRLREIPELNDAIELIKDNLKIKKPVEFDIGGVGKGFLIDQISQMLNHNGIKNFVIDAGGDIYYESEKNIEYRVGLENPLDFSEVIGVVNLKSGYSICGSSQNRRSWKNGSHIINLDQKKYTRKILASWVVSKSATIADSAATCLFFTDAGYLKRKLPGIEYLVLYDDFSFESSSGLNAELF